MDLPIASQIRNHAISKLSALELGSIEKIMLSRAHSVRKWFEEGAEDIVKAEGCPKMDDLLTLGLETGFRLLWIREQTAHTFPSLSLSSLKCNKCHSSMFTEKRACADASCNRVLLPDKLGCISVDRDANLQVRVQKLEGDSHLTGGVFLRVSLSNLSCGEKRSHCPVESKSYSCPSCGSTVSEGKFLLGLRGSGGNGPTITDVFGDELTELGLIDE
jgi:hypothetical protein